MKLENKIGQLVGWLDGHPLVKLGAYAVAAAGGLTVIVVAVITLRDAFKPDPVPEVVQVATVPDDSPAYNLGQARWMVTIMNRSDEPMAIMQAHYEVRRYATSTGYINAMQVKVSRNVYRLPLNCQSGTGSKPLVPPFAVPPMSSATLVIEGDKNDRHCFFRLAFETTQGRTEEMTAEPF